MSIGNLIVGVNSVMVSYLLRYDSLLQNEKTLQNATVITNCESLLQNARVITICDNTTIHGNKLT